MDIIRGLYLSWVQSYPQIPEGARTTIHDLPPELLMSISEHGTLVDAICLAHTCRAIREILTPLIKKRRQQLTKKELRYALWQLSERYPLDYCMCTACMYLHPINVQDVPSNLVARAMKTPCLLLEANFSCNTVETFWSLRQHYVAIALRYSRTANLNKGQKAYLAALLAPHKRTRLVDIRIRLDAEVKPKIAQGHFLLHTRFTFSAPAGVPELPEFRICPHQMHDPNVPGGCQLSHVISAALEWSRSTTPFAVTSACKWCPTEYRAYAKGNEIEVQYWQSLGKEGCPDEWEWELQIQQPSISGQNEEYAGPRAQHMYENDQSRWMTITNI